LAHFRFFEEETLQASGQQIWLALTKVSSNHSEDDAYILPVLGCFVFQVAEGKWFVPLQPSYLVQLITEPVSEYSLLCTIMAWADAIKVVRQLDEGINYSADLIA
jgi:hypothetical protein